MHAYGDALGDDDAGLAIPQEVRRRSSSAPLPAGVERWQEALAQAGVPAPHLAGPDDLCMLPYTSGTTGAPKACAHTHRTVMTSFYGSTLWRRVNAESVFLAVAPLFHLLGLQTNVNSAILAWATIVLLPRWDREAAAVLIERHRVSFWAALPAMLVDFFSQPGIEARDFASLSMVTGGGAATPQRINDLLKDRYGLDYIKGYGLTETASFLCTNPVPKPKRGCLGVPTFGVELRIVDPETGAEVAQGEAGEIVVHAAQVMLGYWNKPQANADSFMVLDGKLNTHPSIQEACVISVPDDKRGETVEAVVALRAGARDSEADLLGWCKEHMATYKAPRIVQIVPGLPKGPTGKIAWRELQEQEHARAAATTH